MVGCKDVKRIAYFFLDGELADEIQKKIKEHLKACSECDGRFCIHTRLRSFLRRRLSRHSAPEHLRVRIKRALSNLHSRLAPGN